MVTKESIGPRPVFQSEDVCSRDQANANVDEPDLVVTETNPTTADEAQEDQGRQDQPDHGE